MSFIKTPSQHSPWSLFLKTWFALHFKIYIWTGTGGKKITYVKYYICNILYTYKFYIHVIYFYIHITYIILHFTYVKNYICTETPVSVLHELLQRAGHRSWLKRKCILACHHIENWVSLIIEEITIWRLKYRIFGTGILSLHRAGCRVTEVHQIQVKLSHHVSETCLQTSIDILLI